MANGLNTKDRTLLQAVKNQIAAAEGAPTQHAAMTDLLWAHHLLGSLLRTMQDD